jgi:hypothetical protein
MPCKHSLAAYDPKATSLTSQPSAASPLQLAKPARHVRGEQVPPEQVAGSALAPVLQVVPQLPQLVVLVFVFTYTSAGRTAGVSHAGTEARDAADCMRC